MIERPRILYRCAFAILLGVAIPACGFAQGQSQTPAQDSSAVRDMPLTGEQRKAYVGEYLTELPLDDFGWQGHVIGCQGRQMFAVFRVGAVVATRLPSRSPSGHRA